jgi:hypothetical protein
MWLNLKKKHGARGMLGLHSRLNFTQESLSLKATNLYFDELWGLRNYNNRSLEKH